MKTEYDDKIKNRLKRAEGQIRGVLNMMDDERDCRDVVTQLSAVRSSIDRAIGIIVAENLVQCLTENHEHGGVDSGDADRTASNDALIQQAIDLIVKSR